MSAYYQHCNTDMCPPAHYYGRHTIACGCGCPKCVPHDPADRIATLERDLAAVTAERDALGAERVMFCAVVDSLTAERDALLESSAEFRMLVLRYYDECGIADDCGIGERLIASLAPTPPTVTPGDGTR